MDFLEEGPKARRRALKHSTCRPFKQISLIAGLISALGWLALLQSVTGSENVPHAPFGEWAEVLPRGQFEIGLHYQESEAYHIWAGNTIHDVTVHSGGEDYGIDINQGYITIQYGIAKRWSADLAIGVTTAAWRYFSNFSPNERPQSTTGLMDLPFGVRYQLLREGEDGPPWAPTITFRAGAILPGTYQQGFPFSPGNRSAAIEPEVLMRKYFGWPGLGAYGDALFRWNRTTENDQYIVSVGLFQQIKQWDLDFGYRHLGSVSGQNIVLLPNRFIVYPVSVRENNDSIEAGLSYTLPKWGLQFGFYSRTVLSGGNSDNKFWVGGYLKVPLGAAPKR